MNERIRYLWHVFLQLVSLDEVRAIISELKQEMSDQSARNIDALRTKLDQLQNENEMLRSQNLETKNEVKQLRETLEKVKNQRSIKCSYV